MILRRQRARVMFRALWPRGIVWRLPLRPRMVANRFDHVAIVEPESVGKAWGGVVRSFTYQ
jgi:hypothetical protein